MKAFTFLYLLIVLFAIGCGPTNTTSGDWVGCIEDKHCEAGEVCIAGNCNAKSECESDSDCLNGQYCNENKLCETFCKSDTDCGVGYICDLESEKCVRDDTKLCEEDSDCKTGEICKDYICIDDPNPTSCEEDSQCKNGEHCKDKKCINNCTADSCEAGLVCNETTKECEEVSCTLDSDCNEGFFCESNKCTTKEYSCEENVDCYRGYHCEDNTCRVDCTINSCPENQICNVVTGECISKEPECRVNQDCPESKPLCREGVCTTEVVACGDGICDIGEKFSCPQDCDTVCDFAYECAELPWEVDCSGYWSCENNQCIENCGGTCGNGRCNKGNGETVKNCPEDCNEGPICGDGTCDDGERFSCPQDCDEEPVCGNGICEMGEWDSCPADCQVEPVCGNNICERGERRSCPQDCDEQECRSDRDCRDNPQKPICENGVCVEDRDNHCDDGTVPLCDMMPPVCLNGQILAYKNSCYECVDPNTCEPSECMNAVDCSNKDWDVRCMGHWSCERSVCIAQCDSDLCGDNRCDRINGETIDSCPQDCREQPPVCGNRICETGEWDSCPIDCQQDLCGNGRCDDGETVDNCPADCTNGESCETVRDCPDVENYVCLDGACKEIANIDCRVDEDCGSRRLICNEQNKCEDAQFCYGDVRPCPDGKICVDYICREDNTDPCANVICDGLSTCVDGECVPTPVICRTAQDCGDPNRFECVNGECLPLTEGCRNDSDCPDGYSCSSDGQCEIVENRDDQFEENDLISSAKRLEPNSTYNNLNVSTTDQDYYFVDFRGQTIKLFAEFSHASGDIDIEFIQNGRTVAVAESGDDNEFFSITQDQFTNGEVIIHVFIYRNPDDSVSQYNEYILNLF